MIQTQGRESRKGVSQLEVLNELSAHAPRQLALEGPLRGRAFGPEPPDNRPKKRGMEVNPRIDLEQLLSVVDAQQSEAARGKAVGRIATQQEATLK